MPLLSLLKHYIVRQKFLIILVIAIAIISCNGKQNKVSYDELGESGLTTRTEYLRDNLKSEISAGTIIGQLYGTLQGVGWVGDSARSDIKSICGDGPAALGYELQGIERGFKQNSDSIAFDDIRQDVLMHFRHGALITMTWAAPEDVQEEKKLGQYTDSIAKFMDSLQDEYGIKVPVVLFPLPYDSESWCAQLSQSDYITLFHGITGKLKEAGVTNAIYGFATEEDITYCPIDDIDVVELRLILSRTDSTLVREKVETPLSKMVDFAKEHFKAVGITTGIEGLGTPDSYTQQFLPLITNHRVSYLMFGRNYGDANEGHYCVPYPGISSQYVTDFVNFYNDKRTLFHHNLNGLYLQRK